MKKLLLPLALLSFAVISLSIVHLDNINKLEAKSKELRNKHLSIMDSLHTTKTADYSHETESPLLN